MSNPLPSISAAAKGSNYVPSSSLFAQLLAAENVKVRINDHATTALFDVKNRVLTMPSWRGFESAAWYLFIAHEVGHALFTPQDWLSRPSIKAIASKWGVTDGQLWTVLITLEDIRIERKIRAKYRGLAGTFSKGYAELLSRDFFKFGTTMTAERWAKYGICDKLNLYGKVGALAGLSLTDPNHIAWYNEAVKAESYDEVIALASKIVEWVKTNKKDQPKPETQGDHGAPEPKPQPQPKPEEKDPSEKPEEGEGDESGAGPSGEDLESNNEPTGDEDADEGGDESTSGDSDLDETETDETEKGSPESEEGDEAGDEDESVSSTGDEDADEGGDESTSGDSDLDETETDEDGDSEDKNAAGNDDDAENGEDTDSTESDEDADGDQGDAKGDSEDGDEDGDDEEGDEAANSDGDDRTTNSNTEDLLTSETKDAADEALKDAAEGYSTGKKLAVLPIDLSFLNIADVDLKTLTDSWTANANARTVFAELVAKHRRDAGAILASMVATFRANQSASVARKTQTAKSGTVDPLKIVGYKTTEDIFLRRAITMKGQNHGFVVNVDFSGSMGAVMPSVLWQLLHLIWFAETIKVPMEVYGFTTYSNREVAGHAFNKDRAAQGFYSYYPEGRCICIYQTSAPAPMKTVAQSMILAKIFNHAGVFGALRNLVQYSRPEAFKAVESNKRYGYTPVPDITETHRTKKLSSYGDLTWLTSDPTKGHSYYSTTPFNQLPVPVKEAVEPILSLSLDELQEAVTCELTTLNGTPLHHALLSQIPVVRAFRERNRVEQCVSLWLTDGADTQGTSIDDPTVVGSPTAYRNMKGVSLFVPVTGKSYQCNAVNGTNGQLDMPMFLGIHRDATGAAVVVVDLSANPILSMARVLNTEELTELNAATAVVDKDGVAYAQVARRSRSRYRPGRMTIKLKPLKATKQTKKTLIIKKSKGSFTDSGILGVDRAMFPNMGADAYVIADPNAFTEASTYAEASARKIAEKTSEATGVNQFIVKNVLTAQAAHLAMRRFAEILVPFLADSK